MAIGIARDISLMCLICPVLICLLVPLGIMFGSWYVTRVTSRALPPQFEKAQNGILRVRDMIVRVGAMVAKPVIFFESQSARWRAMWRAFLRGTRWER